jgi:hypothetical protein
LTDLEAVLGRRISVAPISQSAEPLTRNFRQLYRVHSMEKQSGKAQIEITNQFGEV